MRWFETIRKIAAHVCVICSIILLTARVMDSYNPYMDFTGHSSWAIYALCACSLFCGMAIVLGVDRPKR